MTTRFNYLVFVDIVVVACILVVAGRPDGLAITLSAVIVAACALVYRCSVGVRIYMAGKPRDVPSRPDVDRKFSPTTYDAAEQRPSLGRSKTASWLRDAD
jgi:hypothetical protein